MSCDNYLEWISARLDGELTRREEADLTVHLASCPACRAAADQLTALHTAMGGMECSAPAHLSASVMEAIQAEKRAARRRALRRWGSLAACLALCLGLYALAGLPGQITADPGAPMTVRTVDPAAQPAALGEPDHYDFTPLQTVRVTYGSTPAAPSAVVIGSREALDTYLAHFTQDDLSALQDTCTVEFFRSHRLLAVLVEAESGSIRHELAPQGLTWDSVSVRRTVPPECTDDMAAWLLTARVDTSFQDGDTLSVLFN